MKKNTIKPEPKERGCLCHLPIINGNARFFSWQMPFLWLPFFPHKYCPKTWLPIGNRSALKFTRDQINLIGGLANADHLS